MPHFKNVFSFMEDQAPFLQRRVGKTDGRMLYVGWRHDCRPWWHDKFAPAIGCSKVDVLEIFSKNVADLELAAYMGKYPRLDQIRHGDVRDPAAIPPDTYDVVFWDHGPEHVSESDLKLCTPHVLTKAPLVVYCCPWGEWPQGIEDNNEHEIHRNAVTPEQFKELGFDEIYKFGKSGQKNEGELVGFKFRF